MSLLCPLTYNNNTINRNIVMVKAKLKSFILLMDDKVEHVAKF